MATQYGQQPAFSNIIKSFEMQDQKADHNLIIIDLNSTRKEISYLNLQKYIVRSRI